MNQVPTLVIDENLLIRKPRITDVEERYKLGRSLEFRKMVGGSVENLPPYTIENAKNLYEREIKNRYSWFIEYKGSMIGVCRIRINDNKGTYSIGIYDDSLYSKGIGTKVTKKVLEYGFNVLHLESMELMVLEYNKRAIRCYEKCGYKYFKTLEDNVEIDGKLHNDIIMVIDKHEYDSSKY